MSILPTLIGNLTWKWLEEAAGGDYPFGFHPLWLYFWHPPLMDVLFGILVLASFIGTRRRWWLHAAILGLVSFLVHTIAVVIVTNTQWLLALFIDIRFASVVPVALVATIALTTVTAAVAKSATRRLLSYSTIAGLSSGMIFLLALEIDTTGESWFWRNSVQWILWHASIATALHYAVQGRRL